MERVKGKGKRGCSFGVKGEGRGIVRVKGRGEVMVKREVSAWYGYVRGEYDTMRGKG